jgi:hypothetical protein
LLDGAARGEIDQSVGQILGLGNDLFPLVGLQSASAPPLLDTVPI